MRVKREIGGVATEAIGAAMAHENDFPTITKEYSSKIMPAATIFQLTYIVVRRSVTALGIISAEFQVVRCLFGAAILCFAYWIPLLKHLNAQWTITWGGE